MEWERLTYIGWRLPPAGQLIVLKALARSGISSNIAWSFDDSDASARSPSTEVERMFWSYCIKTQPMKAFSEIRSAMPYRYRDSNPYDRSLHDLLSAEATKQSGVDVDLGPDGYEWRGLVDFLASWNLEEDNPIFQKLLEHGGYMKNETWVPDGNRHFYDCRYLIRESARQALFKRGQSVKTDIVLKKEIPIK